MLLCVEGQRDGQPGLCPPPQSPDVCTHVPGGLVDQTGSGGLGRGLRSCLSDRRSGVPGDRSLSSRGCPGATCHAGWPAQLPGLESLLCFFFLSALGSDTTPLPSWASLNSSTWGSLKQALKGLSVEFALLADKAAQQVSELVLLGARSEEHSVPRGRTREHLTWTSEFGVRSEWIPVSVGAARPHLF